MGSFLESNECFVAVNQYAHGVSLSKIAEDIPGVFDGLDLTGICPKIAEGNVSNQLTKVYANAFRTPEYLSFEAGGEPVNIETLIQLIRERKGMPEAYLSYVMPLFQSAEETESNSGSISDTIVKFPKSSMPLPEEALDIIMRAWNLRCYGTEVIEDDSIETFNEIYQLLSATKEMVYDKAWMLTTLHKLSDNSDKVANIVRWALILPNVYATWKLFKVAMWFSSPDGESVILMVRRGNVGKMLPVKLPCATLQRLCDFGEQAILEFEVRGSKLYYNKEPVA